MKLYEIINTPTTLYRIEDPETGLGPFSDYHGNNKSKRWGWNTPEDALSFLGPDFYNMVWPLTRSGYTMVEYKVTKTLPSEENNPNESIFYLEDVIDRRVTPIKKYLKKKYLHHISQGDETDIHKYQ